MEQKVLKITNCIKKDLKIITFKEKIKDYEHLKRDLKEFSASCKRYKSLPTWKEKLSGNQSHINGLKDPQQY